MTQKDQDLQLLERIWSENSNESSLNPKSAAFKPSKRSSASTESLEKELSDRPESPKSEPAIKKDSDRKFSGESTETGEGENKYPEENESDTDSAHLSQPTPPLKPALQPRVNKKGN